LKSAVKELYRINKNSIENNTKDVLKDKKYLVEKIKEVTALMKQKEGI